MKKTTASRFAAACASALISLCSLSASAAPPVPDARTTAQLAPGGQLRVALFYSLPIYVTPGTAGELRGIAVDLGKAIAAQAGATFVPVRYDAVSKMLEDGRAGQWDVAFLGVEAARREFVEFSDAYINSENTYLVPAGSGLMTVADVDKQGLRVGVATKTVQEGFLQGELRQAKLVTGPGNAALLDELGAGKVDAMAAGRTYLEGLAARMPGYRVVQGNFRPSPIAAAVPKGRTEAAAFVNAVIRHAKESGQLQRSIDEARVVGVSIAK